MYNKYIVINGFVSPKDRSAKLRFGIITNMTEKHVTIARQQLTLIELA